VKFARLVGYIIAAAGTIGLIKAPALAARKRALKVFLATGRRYTFPATVKPRVSFIIPVYNGAHHTLACLLSILAVADGSYEVIVVDDGSTVETAELLTYFENVRVHKNSHNQGFLHSVNTGAALAQGQYLVLLNNDARLIEGSLSSALDRFEAEGNCGLMGARVRHVSGGLQEAGCIIYQDGITNGYLRYEREDDLRALFQRDVDYCSGVFAIITRQQFEVLGGLDEAYAPSYFEETDLCMRLRESGLRCIYNPRLLVDHFEFGSSAKAKSARKKIEMRREVFLKRWSSTLKQQRFYQTEETKNIEAAALRLTPHPRRLIVVNAKDVIAQVEKRIQNKNYQTTIYVIDVSNQLMKLLVAKTDMSVAFAYGSERQLRRFIKRRRSFFDVFEVAEDVRTSLTDQLQKV